MKGENMELELHSPFTEEDWDLITDVDFDNTKTIIFYTKHGKTVKFVKEEAAQLEYYRGKKEGILECTERLKKLNDSFAKEKVNDSK